MEVAMSKHFEILAKKIDTREAIIGVVGLGYVGLPLAVDFGEDGFLINGYDVSPKKIELLKKGGSDVDDIPPHRVKNLIDKKLLRPSNTPEKISEADVIIIAVPTPLNKTKDPDVSYILQATNDIKKYQRPGQLIVLESTTYPGTTEELVLPLLEESGLKCGTDFFLAFSPERVDPGNPVYHLKNTPKVIGGVTKKCSDLAAAFYLKVVQNVCVVSSTKSAEMVKLLENTFRSVNIGLVNEIALMCDRLGVNIWEIIDAASSKPFGFMPFYPGPGLGGHCIPIDPHYLSWKLRALNFYARFIETAGDINSSMPSYVVSKTMEYLNENKKPLKGSKVLILGVTYKRDISDLRESPALDVIQLLELKGADVEFVDPYVKSIKWNDDQIKGVELTAGKLQEADIVIILTDHKAFDYRWITENSKLIFDTRNATAHIDSPKIHRLGVGKP